MSILSVAFMWLFYYLGKRVGKTEGQNEERSKVPVSKCKCGRK